MADTDDSREKRREYMRAWRAANRERLNAYSNARYDPERARERYIANREENQAKGRAYYAAHREQCIATSRAWQDANPDRKKENGTKWMANNPEWCSYKNHGSAARQRGVEFLLTFDEWLAIWQESGKFEQRGRGSDEYCMARNGDAGPYAVGNVRICTNRENAAERWRLFRHRRPP